MGEFLSPEITFLCGINRHDNAPLTIDDMSLDVDEMSFTIDEKKFYREMTSEVMILRGNLKCDYLYKYIDFMVKWCKNGEIFKSTLDTLDYLDVNKSVEKNRQLIHLIMDIIDHNNNFTVAADLLLQYIIDPLQADIVSLHSTIEFYVNRDQRASDPILWKFVLWIALQNHACWHALLKHPNLTWMKYFNPYFIAIASRDLALWKKLYYDLKISPDELPGEWIQFCKRIDWMEPVAMMSGGYYIVQTIPEEGFLIGTRQNCFFLLS
jgi:hypothetical protein